MTRVVNPLISACADVVEGRWLRALTVGDRSYRDAVLSGDLIIEGDVALTRRIGAWLRPSMFAEARRGPACEATPAANDQASAG